MIIVVFIELLLHVSKVFANETFNETFSIVLIFGVAYGSSRMHLILKNELIRGLVLRFAKIIPDS